MDILENRKEAGILLAKKLEKYSDEHPIILGMPRE
jgi:predicted phosphoribosyltransferase